MDTQRSYSKGKSAPALLTETIGNYFDRIVAQFPTNEALVVRYQQKNAQPTRLTYQALQQKVDCYAKALLALGVQKGERVGIWAPNGIQWCISQLATAKIGAILIGINPAFQRHEIEYVLQQSQCNWLIAADAFITHNYTQILYQLIPELLLAAKPLNSERLPDLQAIITLSEEPRIGMIQWRTLPQLAETITADELSTRQQQVAIQDPVTIQYTSGTTGFAKGATLSHFNILNNGFFVTENMRFSKQDRVVIPLPLHHCLGMVVSTLGCITHGATMIFPGELFSPLSVLTAVTEEKATVLHGTPSMFVAELNHPQFELFDLSSLRTGMVCGAPCPPEIVHAVIDKMHIPEIQIAYGMTETGPISSQIKADDPVDKRVNTVGRTLPHLENKIIDTQGNTVARGEIGEICTRGYSVMLGYWHNAEATTTILDAQGWIHSGDLATMDDQGYIHIVGRLKDMIIRGGENIYPREIEDFLHTHPAVADVQVTGTPSEKFGEEVVAWIILKTGCTLTEHDIKRFCKGHIADYKIPRFVRFVTEYPMTATGKVQKSKLDIQCS
ncbi:AMP-binding protein [Shewanella dokdonensis]|uniref:AMP-binding protein n=1 Tax=Shewanella dokdonensis TaxID=712036 RepID=UPI001FD625B3|nr:AMP-binding protein [Shewanella dokdonensis]MCL1073878.1 AMP-binding protein [Shewanella dokdonensis]